MNIEMLKKCIVGKFQNPVPVGKVVEADVEEAKALIQMGYAKKTSKEVNWTSANAPSADWPVGQVPTAALAKGIAGDPANLSMPATDAAPASDPVASTDAVIAAEGENAAAAGDNAAPPVITSEKTGTLSLKKDK